jgi:hypothetical protein
VIKPRSNAGITITAHKALAQSRICIPPERRAPE